jgi:two-component system chemotaxis sensor kinase CheA
MTVRAHESEPPPPFPDPPPGKSAPLAEPPPQGTVERQLEIAEPARAGLGIRVKLVALMVTMTVLVAVTLTCHFAIRKTRQAHAAARERALVYAALASNQLRSAVAFEDRETAREVLSAIGQDSRIDSIAVYTQRGRLHLKGKPSELAARVTRSISSEPVTFQLPGRVLATAPIQSLEGARGNIVIEFSTREVLEERKRLIVGAIAIGGAVLLISIGLAWLLSRSFAGRIERVAGAASAMAAGQLNNLVDETGPNDEIGQLTRTFNAMSRRVTDLLAHIQRAAKEEATRLERLVTQRTKQLDKRNQDLRLVLDTVEQGYVTIDRDGKPVGERSLAVDRWLGSLDETQSIWKPLSAGRADREATFTMAWEQVVEDLLPVEVTLQQLPKRLRVGDRHLSLEYRLLDTTGFTRSLVVISDVTAEAERARGQQEAEELVNVCLGLTKNRAAFREFMAEGQRLYQGVLDGRDPVLLARDLHTLKGNSALFGLVRVSNVCHDLEDSLRQGDPASLDRTALTHAWQHCVHTVGLLLGERNASTLDVRDADYTSLLTAVRGGASRAEIEARLQSWRLEPVTQRLELVAQQLRTTAVRLGKGEVGVAVEPASVLMKREELSDFWSTFSHVVRNAAVHGLEGEGGESRQRARRRGVPEFALRSGLTQGRFFVELADQGPGIDWPALRERAKARGIPHATEEDLEQALFADGMSTQTGVTAAAGRGVGLSAVLAVCVARGGSVRVASAPSAGTTFRFSWPSSTIPSIRELSDRGVPL